MSSNLRGLLITTLFSAGTTSLIAYNAMDNSILEQKIVVQELQKKVVSNTNTMQNLNVTLSELQLTMAKISTIIDIKLSDNYKDGGDGAK